VVFGNSFGNDGHKGRTFDYMLANPPFGVEWKKVQKEVEAEHESQGHSGWFGAGLPRINDGSLLFLQHMISKMRPVDAGGKGRQPDRDRVQRLAAVHQRGRLGQLPHSTYFWILANRNRKSPDRRGKVVLLDARDQWAKMRKSLGNKRKYVTPEQIKQITRLYAEALQVAGDPEHPLHGKVKVFRNESRSRTPTCATTRTCRWTRTWTSIWSARCSPTCPTPGSTTSRPRSGTRSRSPATSTSTPHPAFSPRSTPNFGG
jgi:type I restriction enzyme M protein